MAQVTHDSGAGAGQSQECSYFADKNFFGGIDVGGSKMFRPYTLAKLNRHSDEQLRAASDVAVEQTIVGADYYLEELRKKNP